MNYPQRFARLIGLFLLLAALLPTPRAHAEGQLYVHVVRPGETLASIARTYYGDPRRESVLVAENGLTAHGGAAIVVGLRLVIPWVSYHRVAAGETWTKLAERYYGDPRRAFVLLESNQSKAGSQPTEGAELVIPYPLRHIAAQGETLQKISQLYFDDTSQAKTLKRFNNAPSRLNRGQLILVPMANLVLSTEGERAIEQGGGSGRSSKGRLLQVRADREIPALEDHLRKGRYAEVIALGNRLLVNEALSGDQFEIIQRGLAEAYVALDRTELAVDAFRVLLRRRPQLKLAADTTSPKVLEVFERAKRGR